jgi:hypothetical protein
VLAGEIEETGKRVGRFRVGDRVHAFTKFRFGCYAQYTCLPRSAAPSRAPAEVRTAQLAHQSRHRLAGRGGNEVELHLVSVAPLGMAGFQLSINGRFWVSTEGRPFLRA